jgi:hypothetical protein
VKYGVLKPPKNNNPLEIVSHEYRNIWKDVRNTKNWKHRFMYIFGEPGWTPEGDFYTAKAIQRRLKTAKTPDEANQEIVRLQKAMSA